MIFRDRTVRSRVELDEVEAERIRLRAVADLGVRRARLRALHLSAEMHGVARGSRSLRDRIDFGRAA